MGMDPNQYAERLASDGVVIIDQYFDDDTCDQLFEGIKSCIENGRMDVVEEGEYTYAELANWSGAVANERKLPDDGMIDVFNIDDSIPECDSFKMDPEINEIINMAVSKEYSPDNVNVYWNRSVTTTRNLHADTYQGKFKSFLYLTDVPEKSYGPFSYVKGSHNPSVLQRKTTKLINKIRGRQSTDAIDYKEYNVTYFTAPKGTLIIANQGGYHRGHPQEEGKDRMVLTTSYTPST